MSSSIILYLRDVLSRGELLIDNSFQDRASFIEAFSMKYRECEGLIVEVRVKVDSVRLKKYLADIVRSANELKKIIDDEKLIANIEAGRDDFDQFAEEIENYIQSIR